MEISIICISCPVGCRLTVDIENNAVTTVKGNMCKRGRLYAEQEATAPLRTLTGNMRAKGCKAPFSVISDRPIPKNRLLDCAKELKQHNPSPPIAMGDVVIEDILETGCNIIATQEINN